MKLKSLRFAGYPFAAAMALQGCATIHRELAVEQTADEEPVVGQVPDLGPGQYVWLPAPASDEPVTVAISLQRQLAYVYRGKTLLGASTISSGSKGHTSPVGRFTILEKQRLHHSNRYSEAPMPWMQRLNWYGVALHGGSVPGYPASHGCIRLPMGFAKALFEVTGVGAYVFVTDDGFESPNEALKLALRHADDPMPADRVPRKPITTAMD